MLTRRKAVEWLFLASLISLQLALVAPTIAMPERTWAIVLLVFAIASSITVLVLARALSPRLRIVSLAVCYVGLTVGFGSLHYLLFQRNPQAYVFAEAIESSQLNATVHAATDELEEIQIELRLLRELAANGRSAVSAFRQRATVLLRGGESVTLVDEIQPAPPGFFHLVFLRFQTPRTTYTLDGNLIGDSRTHSIWALAEAKTMPAFLAALEQLRTVLLSRQREAQGKLSQRRPIWHYTDFVYFSAVTISTVGFGDIVPANHQSRLLAGSEATCGVLMIAFAFAFLWPERSDGSAASGHSSRVPRRRRLPMSNWRSRRSAPPRAVGKHDPLR